MAEETVNYRAKSQLASKTQIFNAGVIVLSFVAWYVKPEMFPATYAPMVTALLAAINMWLRTQSKRPVATLDTDGSLLLPWESKPVAVKKLD